MRAHRRSAALALAIVAAAILAGCTATAEPPSQSASATASASASTDSEASGADDAGIDPGDPPEALASTTLNRGGDGGVDSVLIEIVGMRHVENVLVMTVRLTASGDDSGTDPVSAFKVLGGTFYPSLIDYANLKKYDFVPGLNSDVTAVLAPIGTAMYLSATFAYPQDADTVEVVISPGITPIADVPVP